ncbi:MAG: hypothetical protein J6J58_07820 [Oscillospiraceae bacterium]|nr:hypothetical protein [Oscillospiraceae bacterium]
MKNIVNKSSLALAAAAYIVYFICAILCGGNILGIIGFNLCLLVGVMACGNLLQNVLLKKCGLYENLPISFCLGVLFLYINYIVFDTIGFSRGLIILPLAFGVYHLYKNKGNIKPDFIFCENSWVSYLTFVGFCAAFVICVLLPYARADILKNFYVHQDMIWSAGNAASVYLGFPLQDMRLAGTTLNYHYLNDAAAGMLGLASGQPAYESFCFYWYMPVAIILIAGLYQTAKKFCDSDLLCRFIPFIVLFTLTYGGEFHYLSNINGQGSATLTLCAGLLLADMVSQQDFSFNDMSNSKKGFFVLCCISVGFVISMFKSTIGALFVLAVVAACVVGLFTKKAKKEHLIMCVCLAAGFGLAYAFIFNRAINNLVFDGWDKLLNLPATLKDIGIGVWIYAAALVFSLIRFKKLSFLQLCANAMFVGGCVAYVTYYHYSASQVYFILIAMPMMWLASSDFLGRFVFNKKVLGYIFIAVMVAVGLFNSRHMLDEARSGVQAALRIADLRMFDFDESYVTADDYEAMLWLRENTDQEDIFATNRNNKYFSWGEGTFHYYTAVSQRACFLESYRYCMDYSGMYHEVVRRLEDVSDHIFHRADEVDAFSLAMHEGIDYLVVFTPVSDPDWDTVPVFENSTVKIYEVW